MLPAVLPRLAGRRHAASAALACYLPAELHVAAMPCHSQVLDDFPGLHGAGTAEGPGMGRRTRRAAAPAVWLGSHGKQRGLEANR